jgi:hypothetical protein
MVTAAQEDMKRPPRDAAVVVRLSASEKARLEAYAVRRDLRVGQAARHFINEALAEGSDGGDGRP